MIIPKSPEGGLHGQEKMLELARMQIEKKYGKGSIMKLGEKAIEEGIQVIPTGALTLDFALGVGGIPRGRIIEIFGPESSGKTTLALQIIAETQKMGGVAAFIDAEHALDPLMQGIWALTSTTCLFLNLIRASRHLKLPKLWSEAERLMS